MSLPYHWPGEWTTTAPSVEDHRDGAELVWVVRGYPFTRPVVARTNIGVRYRESDGKVVHFVHFVRVELMADGHHGIDASKFPWIADLEWRGPMAVPRGDE